MMKAVLFDLDGTLLDRETSIEQFIAAQYDRLNHCLRHISKHDYMTRFIELDCHGHVWKDKVYQTLVAEFSIMEMSWQALLDDYDMHFQHHCVPFDFLFETLDTLKQQGYKLGVVTNGLGEFQARSIVGLQIQDYFDSILISEVEQIRKPQPEIFQRALERLGISAENSVFVGDHPNADISGAKSANMKAIWKRNSIWPEATEADAAIDQLNEIPLLLSSKFFGNPEQLDYKSL
jgi:putative hydrolase of the HAD superfamily